MVGEFGPSVKHGEGHSLHLQTGIEVTLYQLHRIHELAQPLQRKIFALDRHHKGIGGGQGVERKQSQGWRAVNEDKIEAAPNHIQRPF